MTYDGSDLYDFSAHLPRVKARTTYWDTVEGLAAPTCKQLLRHAQKFGPAMVNETAAQFGVKMERLADEQPKRQRRSGPTVKAQVLELHARGAVPAAIADTLNLADRRVKEIIAAA